MIDYVTSRTSASSSEDQAGAVFHDYQLDPTNMYMWAKTIEGRYPQQGGYLVDDQVEQMWYVAEGSGTLWIDQREERLGVGDMILVPRGKKYWIEGSNLRIVMASQPKWYEQQHRHVMEEAV